MTELEKKLLLTEDEYDYLMERLSYENPLIQNSVDTQINYYFDTDDLSMNHQNITCRIRLKDGKYKATMKKHSLWDERSTENEMEIYNGLDGNSFTDMGLKLQGELITKRCVVMKNSNCEVVLDKNEYLGHIDYELEIEYTPEYEKDAGAILKIFRDMLTRRKCFLIYKEGIEMPPIVPSKSKRFFERMSAVKASEQKSVSDEEQITTTEFDYSDPDDYMRDCFDCIMSDESICLSCINFNGHSCDAPDGSCHYGK